METIIKALGPEDAALVCNSAGVFDHTPNKSLTTEFLSDSRHHLIAAIESGRIIGFISAVHYVHPDKPPELWINEIGVTFSHQRRGVGRRLIQAMLARGRQFGCRTAWVLTDRSNTPAMQLYSGAGGIASPVPSVMFEFHLHADE